MDRMENNELTRSEKRVHCLFERVRQETNWMCNGEERLGVHEVR